MDRTVAPKVERLKSFEYIKAKEATLDNGIKVFYTENPKQEAIKIDIVFSAGYAHQQKPLQAAAVADLLEEGTLHKNSEALAAAIEQEGAILQTSVKADFLEMSLYCLASKVEAMLPIVLEMIEESIFPEEELADFIENKKQKFSISQQKVDFLVRNEFLATIFGADHPYNNQIKESDFDNLERKDLLSFYEGFIKNKTFTLFVSGKVTSREIELLNQFFGKNNNLTAVEDKTNCDFQLNPAKKVFIEKPNATQAAIRLGMPTIGKDNIDFPALFFTNTLLGGFFGSRLMTNIREDKGYTYGIGSALVSLKKGAYFFIASELGANYLDATLKEIKIEVERLKTEKITDKELQLVKNYLKGKLMKNFDGAFAAMDRFKSIHALDLDYSYYDNLFAEFYKMTAEKVADVSRTYLNYEKFNILVAGKK